MKVYNRNPLGIDLPPLESLVVPIIVVLLLVGGVLLFSNSTQTGLSARLIQNPIFLSANDSTILEVVLTNPTSATLSNIVLKTETLGSNQLSVYPAQQTIQSLGPNETRKLEFLVEPIDTPTSPFLPGNYRIDVKTMIQGQAYQTNVILTVEK
ncbi:MAG: hypothetical protein AABX02_02710 [archaeon]